MSLHPSSLQTALDPLTSGQRDAPVFMKKWFRTDRAIVMYLSNGTLQVGCQDAVFGV